MKEVRQKTMPGLQIVTTGPPPPNPAGFLRFQRFGSFLERVCREFDYTLLDVPPTSFVSGPPERRPAQVEGSCFFWTRKTRARGPFDKAGEAGTCRSQPARHGMNNFKIVRKGTVKACTLGADKHQQER